MDLRGVWVVLLVFGELYHSEIKDFFDLWFVD